MPSIDDVFTGSYMKAADVPPAGLTLTIASTRIEQFEQNGKQQPKIILAFAGHSQEFVCNKTNAMWIAEGLGKDYTQWAGHPVKLHVEKVEFAGKLVDAIRARTQPQQPRQAPPPPQQQQPPVAAAQGVPQPTQAPPAPSYEQQAVTDAQTGDFDDSIPW